MTLRLAVEGLWGCLVVGSVTNQSDEEEGGATDQAGVCLIKYVPLL